MQSYSIQNYYEEVNQSSALAHGSFILNPDSAQKAFNGAGSLHSA